MCGLAGFVETNLTRQASDNAELLAEMAFSLKHRGPDEEGAVSTHPFYAVFRRLAIVDRIGGAQPFYSEDGNVVALVNGEIYNHLELKSQYLASHDFRSSSDCESVVHLFEEFGSGCFSLLDGKFALALWDRRSSTLVLARDPLGVKPLYYARLSSGLVFGSELKALLAHPDCPRSFDWSDLVEGNDVPSFVRGVEILPGGSVAVFKRGQLTLDRSWDLSQHLAVDDVSRTDADFVSGYAERLERAVRKRLMGDRRPVGVFLSGGIDSCLLASIAASERRTVGETPPRCFTILERSTYYSGDADAAERLAQYLRVPIHLMVVDTDLLERIGWNLNVFEYYVWLMDRPTFKFEFLLKHELHKCARSVEPHLKVMLNGQGADEFAGGYSFIPFRSRHNTWDGYINAEVRPTSVARISERLGVPRHLTHLVSPDFCSRSFATPGTWFQRAMLDAVATLQRYNLWHEDRTAAANGIEARLPFLDRALVEWAAGIPDEAQRRLFWNKGIVRRAAAKWLPSWALERAKVPLYSVGRRESIWNLMAKMMTSIYGDFRRSYLEDGLSAFERKSLDGVAEQIRASPDDIKSINILAECMAIDVFRRLLVDPGRRRTICVNANAGPSKLDIATRVGAVAWD